MNTFTGTGVAVVTPFDVNLKPDLEALKTIINHLIAGKVEYLVALGTTGESVTLSDQETYQVLETFFETVGDRVPIVTGAGGNNTAKVIEAIAKIEKHFQPAGILSVSPYYNKPTQQGIYAHFHAVAASTDCPIIIYNVPGRTASNIDASTTLSLAHDHPNIVAIKEASGNLEQGMNIIAAKPSHFQVLSGDDVLGLPQIAVGYEGVISVAANAFPQLYSEIVRSALNGYFAKANSYHYRLLKVMQLHFSEGNPAGVKAAMELLGLCHRRVRLPLVQASEALVADIKKELTLIN